jgi:hypothetical protein
MADWTPRELAMIAAAERELGRTFKPDELDMLRQPVTAEDLQELLATLLQYDEAEEREAGRQRAR